LFDELGLHILKRLEASPEATFRESELAGISRASFDKLVKDRYLVFDHYDKNGESYHSDREGDGDYERVLRIKGDAINAFSADPAIATIQLTKPEITYYKFDRDYLAQQIKSRNQLAGENDDSFSERLFYIGTDFTTNTVVLLGYFDDEKDAKNELLSLWSKIPQHDNAVVICPAFNFVSLRSKKELENVGIAITTFDRAFGKDFQLDLSKCGIKKSVSSGLKRKSKQDEADYEKHDYKSHETLVFFDRQDSDGYVIQIGNSAPFGISRANYVLLLYMAMALKKDKEGFIIMSQTDKEGITDEYGDTGKLYYLISDLRKSFKNKSKDPNLLIQSIKGKGQYRISTHPNYIKAPDRNWLKKKYDELIPEVKKERQRRKKQG
jgi:hypothetical protein